MARARNIKPSIMENEELAEQDPLTRLLFVYLWMLADREGRLEDRPKRIAAQALPYDRAADVDAMLNGLQASGFITRYTANGIACIQILSFAKHQNPHVRESVSSLPAMDGGTTKAMPKNNPGGAEASPRSPDSGFRIPDSLIPECGAMPAPHTLPDGFAEVIAARPELDAASVYRKFCEHKPAKQQTLTTWRKWVADERGPDEASSKPPSTADPDSRASIEANGLALGLGKWDELEHFSTYKARVRRAQWQTQAQAATQGAK